MPKLNVKLTVAGCVTVAAAIPLELIDLVRGDATRPRRTRRRRRAAFAVQLAALILVVFTRCSFPVVP